jgi:hypothetical protein
VTVGDAVAVMGVLAAVTGTVVAFLAYRAGGRADRKKDMTDGRRQAISEALHPLTTQVTLLADQVKRMGDSQHELAENMSRQDRDMAETRAKVDMFWAVLGKEAARNLHAPHPGRLALDRLLEKFTAFADGDGPAMTAAELAELRASLQYITGLPEGGEPGFPVLEGDRVWASILLASLGMMQGGDSHARP